jgi:gas vesicle protein GvpG
MFLIDDLLLSPGSFLLWVMRKIHEAAQEELENAKVRITTELSELLRTLETGAINEAQFDAREKELLDRLDRIRQRNDDFESAQGKNDEEE